MSNRTYREDRSREDRLLFSGGLGISLLAVIQLLQLTELDWALSFSLHCFALSMPLTAMGVFLMDLELSLKRHINGYVFALTVGIIGLVATVSGVAGLFIHLGYIGKSWYGGWEVAMIFGISTLIAIVLAYYSHPRRN
jgi:ABC-type amino acid transport system permease subunit